MEGFLRNRDQIRKTEMEADTEEAMKASSASHACGDMDDAHVETKHHGVFPA